MRERSELTGWPPQGRITAGGSGRLLPGADGWLAVSLPRLDDLDLLPAWLGVDEIDPADDRVPWDAVGRAARALPVADGAALGQELGLAVAVVADAERLPAGDEQLAARGTLDAAVHPPAIGGRRAGRALVRSRGCGSSTCRRCGRGRRAPGCSPGPARRW